MTEVLEPMDSTSLQSPSDYPDEWKHLSFDDFTTLQRGKDLTREQFRDGIVPVAGSNGRIGFHDTANVTAPGVTVGRSGSVGRVTFYAEDFWAHNTALYVKNFHGNDARFAAYFLESLKLNRFGSGVSVPTLDRNVFRILPVIVPPLSEQRRIAGVLGLVQRAVEQQERLLALVAELKQTLLHHVFTHGLRGEPQKPTDLGPIPQSWEVVRLGDSCRIRTGKKDVNEGNPNGKYPFFTCSRETHFSDEFSFDTEAILVAGNGAVGETKYYKGKFQAYQRTYVLDDFVLHAPFVFHFLRHTLMAELSR